ncbi:MAG TPA: D-xylose ABC transporter ATP-binding protein, partial [Verrucomicrobia bacterium]|nr:D-xylose ABC transporter ATP-binding protein [Verrucomicrobiota bacterium]
STLMKILGGVYRAEGGAVLLHGKAQNFTSPRAAAQAGIAIIHQELSLVPTMSVAENLLLGRQPRTAWGSIDYRRMEREALRWLGELDLVLDDVWAAVETLSIGLQQLVEIAKALSWEASVLVMDEPTSALSDQDARRLFETIARLKGKGVGIVYISHKMDEIYRLADRITVLRDGRWIGSAPAAG